MVTDITLSLPEIATNIVDKTLLPGNDDNSCTVVMAGSKEVGKSTLLHTFLGKTEAPRETLVLEYSFGRRTTQKQGMEKTICHVWEYGGKLEALKNVITSISIKGSFYFFIVMDLSKIKRVWDCIETCINAIHETYINSEKKPEVVIVGGKYDLFKNYDSEIKKAICATIRSVAIIHKAHVMFYTSKDTSLVRRAKEMLQSCAFGSGIVFKEKNANYTKPLFIPMGSDSWESIGTSPTSIEQLKAKHLSRFPPETVVPESSAITVSQKARAHPEPSLDKLAALKYEQLINYQQQNVELMDIYIDDYVLSLAT